MTVVTNSAEKPKVWTIGHSTHSWEEFVELLRLFKIECLADVRSLPGSNKFPQFDKENMEKMLPVSGVLYKSFKEQLGGRRKFSKNSKNIAWHHPSFRSYADYMETDNFREGIAELEKLAGTYRTAYMCAEAVWWRCHRSMISDYLKLKGWQVLHIVGKGTPKEHPYTGAAVIVNGELHYDIVAGK